MYNTNIIMYMALSRIDKKKQNSLQHFDKTDFLSLLDMLKL